MLGFKSTASASITLSGIEMVHMMRKGCVANFDDRRNGLDWRSSCHAAKYVELLGQRWIWIKGKSRLSFAHHVNQFDPGQNDCLRWSVT